MSEVAKNNAASSSVPSLADTNALLMELTTKVAEADVLRGNLDGIAKNAQTKLSEIQDIATAALAAKTQIADEQAVIVTKSAHIQNAQDHADKIRTELDKIQTAATLHATEAEGLRTRVQTATDNASELLAVVQSHKTSVETDAAAVKAELITAKTAANTTKSLADKAKTIEDQVAAYEQRLADLEAQSKAQLDTITSLLPGATAAGLAHAFNDRRQTFLKPGVRWQWLYIGSVVLIVILALSGLWHVYRSGVALSWDELARLWTARLPIAAALLWLALHASRESALAKRLEEDYGYKAAIAASFQGFQKQMAEIDSNTQEGSALSKLCEDTLSTIGNPPGRIYEKHQLTLTPTSEFIAAVKQAISSEKLKS